MKEGIEKPKIILDEFRDEIRNWVAGELEKKVEWEARGRTGPAYDPHADYIDADDLTEEDMLIWNKYRKNTITRGDFEAYNILIGRNRSMGDSRGNFRALLGNKINNLLLKKDSESRRIKK